MAKLTYGTGTSYSKTDKQVTTTFNIDELFDWAKAQPTAPKRKDVDVKLAQLNGKKENYQRHSQLLESEEFHTACHDDGHANVIALTKNKREVNPNGGGPRANGDLTKSQYEAIGKLTVEALTKRAKAQESGDEERGVTMEWAEAETNRALANVNQNVKTQARPVKVLSTEQKLTASQEKIASGVLKARAAGKSEAEIVETLFGIVDEKDVKAILKNADQS